MSTRLVPIESFDSPYEAEIAKRWLEDHGVEAYVDGSSSFTALSYVGSALAGVRLMVVDSQIDQAQIVLRDFVRDRSQAHGFRWWCGSCREENESSFDLCWRCGRDRREVEAEFPIEKRGQSTKEPVLESTDVLPTTRPVADETNPYSPTSVPSLAQTITKSDGLLPEESEEMLQRAWRSSVLGITLPFLLTLYSVVLLLGAMDTKMGWTSKGKRYCILAWAMNIFVLMFWTLLFLFFYPWYYWPGFPSLSD